MEIKTVTVVPADRFVAVNGEGYQFDYEVADPLPGVMASVVHAIQWWDDHGHIEVSRGPARGFTDGIVVAPYVKAWFYARAAQIRAGADHIAKQVALQENQLAVTTENLAALAADIKAASADPALAGFYAAMQSHYDVVSGSCVAQKTILDDLRTKAVDAESRAVAAQTDAEKS